MKTFYVYILASKRNGTLYVGVTSDLEGRVWDHKQKTRKGFTSKYNVDKLVWYEEYPTADEAIDREKDIKKWKRAWKLRLIEEMNPDWRDLYEELPM
ncbi:GIY-YIG nuclease family protein [Terrarubrum flagellatum]|uniref:GIY-YIG nuclease family protein n=1 Tax=Terrirubrum flagellatum TaxID=2895980 RepID=UPI003144DF82